MKTLEVVIKMAFLVFKNVNFPQISANWQQKFKFSEKFLKFYPIKRENVFKFWTISVLFLDQWKKPYISSSVISLARQKIERPIFLFTSCRILGWKSEFCSSSGISKVSEKNWKTNHNLSLWIPQKSTLFSAVSEEISAVQFWFSTVS